MVILQIFQCINSSCTGDLPMSEDLLRHIHTGFSSVHIRSVLSASYINTSNVDCNDTPSSQNLQHRALCPWDLEENRNISRYPHTLHSAKCRCAGCLDNYECQPILYRVPIVLKTCNSANERIYVPSYEHISVGCTCVRPMMYRVQRQRYHRRHFSNR